MSRMDDHHTNAVVGQIVSVANRSWADDGSRMVTIKCDDPFDTVYVREFVTNWEDAEVLVDMMAVVYDHRVYLLGASE